MKHLKIYETFNSYDKIFESTQELLYKSMSEEEFYEYDLDRDNVKLPESIRLIMNEYGFQLYDVDKSTLIIINGRKNFFIKGKIDNYYLVREEVDDIMSSPYNESFIYYICDDIEGLKQYLKNNIIR